MEQQQKLNLFPKVIDMPEINVNSLPKATSSILNKLLPHDTPSKDEISPSIKPASILPSITSIENFILMRNENPDQVTNAEMIEIEVPLIENDYRRETRDKAYHGDVSYGSDYYEDENDYYYEAHQLPVTSRQAIPETTQHFEASTDFQTTTSAEADSKSFYETLSPPQNTVNDVSPYSPLTSTDSQDEMHAIESKLMDQYHSSDSSETESNDEIVTEKLHFKAEEVTATEQTTEKPLRQYRHKYPFSVKVIVNNEDEKTSCKNKQSCTQVSYSRNRDIDQEYYRDDSDEDIFFKSDYHDEKPNQLKSRRAADDSFFNTFNGLSLTPAPRFGGFSNSNFMGMPNVPPVPIPPMTMKKPSFIERLENESSLERSERVNKDLNSLMKFIAVWAHVDKFVSDRARSTIKKLAYMTDDDFVENFELGSRKKVDNNLNTIAQNADEPFT